MSKIDYKKELKEFYRPPAKKVVTVDVPEFHYLMVDGKGVPESQSFKEAVEALFSLSYTLKFMVKKEEAGTDYVVMPLEGLWWAEDYSDFVNDKKENWIWTLMIMQPEHVDAGRVQAAFKQVREKKDLPAIDQVRYEAFTEGPCAQTMHVGPFSEEGPTVKRVHAYIEASGNTLSGKHHEIYLSDIRRAAPENWKTVIRQPMSGA